jgi:hypothetical protein
VIRAPPDGEREIERAAGPAAEGVQMTRTFQRFAAGSAVLAAAASLIFTVAFAQVVQEGDRWAQWLAWSTLLAGSLITVPVMTALHVRLGRSEPEFAMVGFVLGVGAAIGASVHAAYELSVLANEPSTTVDLPSAIDPRGFLTFAVTGLAVGVFGWLILRDGGLPRRAGHLALFAAVLLIVVFIGRLTVLNPKTNVIRIAALASGLVLLPAFYLQVGRALLKGDAAEPQPATLGLTTAGARS